MSTLAMQLHWGQPAWLFALLAMPVLTYILYRTQRARVAAGAGFGGAESHGNPTLKLIRPGIAIAKIGLCMVGSAALIVALARPQTDPVEQRATVRGRDIVFILDASRSMLARDVAPDRLSRAKVWIKDLVSAQRGDRVGLIAFAGVPIVKCPLTLDYSFFSLALDEISPASVPRGGTLIGDAIRKAMTDVFEPGDGKFRDIVLISDGEDQESFPEEAAKQAAEAGARIIAIGIGSEIEGSLVPRGDAASDSTDTRSSYIEHDGQAVRTRMDTKTLASLAAAANAVGGFGTFLNVGTGTINLDEVYRDLTASVEQRETQAEATTVYRELFPIFLAIALACLILDSVLIERTRASVPRQRAPIPQQAGRELRVEAPRGSATTATVAAILISGMCAMPRGAGAQEIAADAPSLYNAGREFYAKGDFLQAADRFRKADAAAHNSRLAAMARFNLGQALLKDAVMGFSPPPGSQADSAATDTVTKLENADRAFRSALEADPDDAQAARNVELVRRLIQRARDEDAKRKQQQESNSSKRQPQSGESGKNGQQGSSPSKSDQMQKASEDKQRQAEQLRDLAEQQAKAAQTSERAASQQAPEQRQTESQAAEKAQEDVSTRTKSAQSTAETEDAKTEGAQTRRESLGAARKEQTRAEEALANQDLAAAAERQREAAKHLEGAADAAQREAEQLAQEASDARAAEKRAQEAKDEGKQAKKAEPKGDGTASQLMDREKRQRESRQRLLRALQGRPQPVERDW